MRPTILLLTPLLAAGCATQPKDAQPTPAPVVVAAVMPTMLVETRYDVRSYRDAANPSCRHEAHAIYRRTRVPLNADGEHETVPRTSYTAVSHSPLPASEELAAELAAQRQITAELRAMQAALASGEQELKAQYATLARQSAEVLKLKEQIEAERKGLSSMPPGPDAFASASSAEVKW